MKSLKGVVLGTVLGLSLCAMQLWAQSQMSPDQTQDQAQPSQDQTQPMATPDAQISQAPPPPPEMQAQKPSPIPATPGQGDESATQPDPPSRVARLQYTSGSVSIQPQGTGDWITGPVNRPLTNLDNVWTDQDAKAELNVGDGLLRMGSESSLTVTNVSDNAVQIELHQGTLNLRVRNLMAGETFEVDTPNMAFTAQKAGEYRFDVDPDGDASTATVWQGEGEATGNGPAVRVNAGERARFTNGTSLTHDISAAPAADGFDDWCRVRDQRVDHSVSAQYVAPGTIGSEDLDEYGSWRNSDSYGEVWYPSGVSAGWAPYTYGHWVWIGPWGWTWVDDEPWGFAPFHYGRWIYGGGGWGWAPGPYYARPFYAPALVAWFGGPRFGAGFGFGFGGGIGWCPLGFGEPFFPWYRGSWGYFSRVNFYNARIGNIDRFRGFYHGGVFAGASFRYSNLRAPGGAIAVSQRNFANSAFVRSAAVHVPASEFSHASLSGRLPVNPTMNSRLGGSRATAAPSTRAFSRPVASRMGSASGTRGAGFASNARFGGNAGASSRFVPRPPQSNGGAMNRGGASGMTNGRSYSSASMSRNVPRPPGASMGAENRMSRPGGSSGYEPRGQGNSGYSRPSERSTPRSSPDSSHGRNFTSDTRSEGSSPYASRGYGGYSSQSQSRSYAEGGNRSYGQARSYSSPSYRGYSAPESRSYSAQSYRGSSSPSYRSYSAPSSRSYSAPSYRSSGGGSFRGSSGGGGGGSHSSAGGGGRGGHR